MSFQKLISGYANYNRWANESMLNWLAQKPSSDYYKTVSSSYPSILLTMNHILAVEEFWYAVVSKTPALSGRYMLETADHEEVFPTLKVQSALLSDYVSGLKEADLLEEIHLDTPWVKGDLPRYEFIQHLFNHSTYHRGQLVSIGRNLGYTDAPMTDYNFYNMTVLQRGIAA